MNLVTFPGLGLSFNIRPIAFHVFGWPIHWYGLIIAAGFLLAVYFCSRRADQYGVEQDNIIDLLLYAVPLCIIGARLYYIIFYLDLYRTADGGYDVVRMLRIWDGGIAIYGGIIMAAIVAWLFCRSQKISFLSLADLGVFGLFIGQLVGRWGNFVNAEAYGSETSLPWRMGVMDSVAGYIEVHPTFLYESLWNLAGLLLLIFLVAPRRKYDGQNFLFYIAWYGLGRAFIEGLRTDSLYLFSTGIRVSQLLAIITCVAATAALIYQHTRSHDPEALWVRQWEAKKALKAAEGDAGQPGGDAGFEDDAPEKEEQADDQA